MLKVQSIIKRWTDEGEKYQTCAREYHRRVGTYRWCSESGHIQVVHSESGHIQVVQDPQSASASTM